MSPPLHPWLPWALLQSTSCCSEKDTSFPVAICQAPSVDPVDEKAQQLPHWPWFLMGVTAPLVLQSTEDGRSTARRPPMYLAANSSSVRSANWLRPMVQERPLELWATTFAAFWRNTLKRMVSSSVVP